MQKVDDLTRIVMGTVGALKVDKLTILGGIGGVSAPVNVAPGATGGNGAGAGNGRGEGLPPDLTGRLIAANEQIKAATGIDLGAALHARVAPSKGDATP